MSIPERDGWSGVVHTPFVQVMRCVLVAVAERALVCSARVSEATQVAGLPGPSRVTKVWLRRPPGAQISLLDDKTLARRPWHVACTRCASETSKTQGVFAMSGNLWLLSVSVLGLGSAQVGCDAVLGGQTGTEAIHADGTLEPCVTDDGQARSVAACDAGGGADGYMWCQRGADYDLDYDVFDSQRCLPCEGSTGISACEEQEAGDTPTVALLTLDPEILTVQVGFAGALAVRLYDTDGAEITTTTIRPTFSGCDPSIATVETGDFNRLAIVVGVAGRAMRGDSRLGRALRSVSGGGW